VQGYHYHISPHNSPSSEAQLDLFMSALPYRPYCADDLANGLLIRPRHDALKHRHIQANPPTKRAFLLLDVDRPAGAHAWNDGYLPPPTWTATNPNNGHAHIAYALTTPVITTNAARLKPLRYLASIETGYRLAARADRAYTALITKNPVHLHWIVDWGRVDPFSLDELAEYLPVLPKPETRRDQVAGVGRNVMLFELLRRWAYTAIRTYRPGSGDCFDVESRMTAERWHDAVEARANAINAEFAQPLLHNEIRATAKSVAKWVWQRFEASEFSERQSRVASRPRPKSRAKSARTHDLLLVEALSITWKTPSESMASILKEMEL
jgi:hypothetical protein